MKKQVIVFLVLAFGITWSTDALIIAGKVSQASMMVPGMWGPGLAAIITSLFFNKSIMPLGLAIKNKQYLLAGYFLPLLYAVPVYVAIWFFGFAPFNSGIHFSWLAVFTLGQVQSLLMATGEEIGWRGFLYPELSKKLNRFNAAFITGITWAAWYYPLIIYAHHQGPPLWYVLSCFSLMIISMSFITAWLRDRSKNIWPGVLLLTSHNFYIQVFLNNLTKASPYREYVYGEFGIGLALSTFILATMLWLKHEKTSLNNTRLVTA
jgi:membrane protease YdiL (CAAX protease family)